jgi:hypothetical protein
LQYTGTVTRTTANNTFFSYEWPAIGDPANIIIDNSGGVTMPSNSSRTIDGVLTLQAGILNIAGNTLTLSSSSAGAISYGTASSFSAGNMVKADGGGQLTRAIAGGITSNTDYVFPVGNGVPDYFGLKLTFSNTSTGGNLGVKVSTTDHANMGTPAIHLTRYWSFATPLGGSYIYRGAFDYNTGTYLSGTPESSLHLSRWGNTLWTEYSGSSGAGGVLTETTPLDEVSAPLSFDFTGRTANPTGFIETDLETNGFGIVGIYPDKENETVSLIFTAEKDGVYQISIYDVLGRLVIAKKTDYAAKGPNEINLDFSSVKHALYIVTLSDGSKIIAGKLVY